jgi:hypothetical protein
VVLLVAHVIYHPNSRNLYSLHSIKSNINTIKEGVKTLYQNIIQVASCSESRGAHRTHLTHGGRSLEHGVFTSMFNTLVMT